MRSNRQKSAERVVYGVPEDNDRKLRYPSELRQLIADFLEQQGVGRDLLRDDESHRKVLKARVRKIIASVKGDSSNAKLEGLIPDVDSIRGLRNRLGIDRWLPLATLVSFVRTLISTTAREERAKVYEHQVRDQFNLDDLRKLLANTFDVFPSRIERDISRQSGSLYQAIVELVSNAYDSYRPDTDQIGRFGMGFYQIINHLRKETDSLKVTTQSKDARAQPIYIELRNRGSGPEVSTRPVTFDGSGTLVTLTATHLDYNKAFEFLIYKFSHTQGVSIQVNGRRINTWAPTDRHSGYDDAQRVIEITLRDGYCSVQDFGKGMNAFTVLENLLTPKLSDKPPVYRLGNAKQPVRIWFECAPSVDKDKHHEVVIQVGGVTIERHQVKGLNTCAAIVIDLPAYTIIGEERNRIEVNALTVEYVIDALSLASRTPSPWCEQIFNSLAPVIYDLQARNIEDRQDKNLVLVLQRMAAKLFEGRLLVPNDVVFSGINPNGLEPLFVDPCLARNPLEKVPGISLLANVGGIHILETQNKGGAACCLVYGSSIIIDTRLVKCGHPRLIVKSVRDAFGIDLPRSIFESVQLDSTELEAIRTPLLTLEGHLGNQWRDWGFSSIETARFVLSSMKEQDPEFYQIFAESIAPFSPPSAHRFLFSGFGDSLIPGVRTVDALRGLAEVLEIIFANPPLRDLLFKHDVPIFAAFTPLAATSPKHLAQNRPKSSVSYEISGSVFYQVDLPDSWEHIFVSAEGRVADSSSCRNSQIDHEYSFPDIKDNYFPLVRNDPREAAQVGAGNYPKEGAVKVQGIDGIQIWSRLKVDNATNGYHALGVWGDKDKNFRNVGTITFNSMGQLTGRFAVMRSTPEGIEEFLKQAVTSNGTLNPYTHWYSTRENLAGLLNLVPQDIGAVETQASDRIIIRDSREHTQVYATRGKVVEHFLDTKLSPLSENGKQNLPHHLEAISAFTFTLGCVERDKLARLIVRTLKYADLSPEYLSAMIPVLYEVDDLSPRIMSSELVDLLYPMIEMNSDRLVRFVRLVHHCLPDDQATSRTVLSRAIGFYNQHLRHKPLETTESIIDALSEVHFFNDQSLYCDGYTAIREGHILPFAEIPKAARVFIVFMSTDASNVVREGPPLFTLPRKPAVTLQLSELIQWKRLFQNEARQFTGTAAMLYEKVKRGTATLEREHIRREITHAIHYLNVSAEQVHLREGVQNALDSIEGCRDSRIPRVVEVDFSHQGDNALLTTITDQVGIGENQIVNFLLPLDESSKLEGQSVGWMGVGFYSFLREEAMLKTSVGDGRVWYLQFTPISENGTIVDHEVSIWNEQGDWRGFSVVQIHKTKDPVTAAVVSYDSLLDLTSAIDNKRIKVEVKGSLVNPSMRCLSTEPVVGLGMIRIYRHPGNVYTQHGFKICDLALNSSDFFEATLKRLGIVIDVPHGIPLTGSRNNIATKELLPVAYVDALRRAKFAAYFEGISILQKEGKPWFPWDMIPYDYFLSSPKESYPIPPEIQADATAVIEGKAIADMNRYTDRNNLIRLLSLLPLFPVYGERLSLEQIAINFNEEKLGVFQLYLPGPLQYLLQHAALIKEMRKAQEASRATIREKQQWQRKDFQIPDLSLNLLTRIRVPEEFHASFFQIAAAYKSVSKWVNTHSKWLGMLDRFTKYFLKCAYQNLSIRPAHEPKTSFYLEGDYSIAHCQRRLDGNGELAESTIGWNLQPMIEFSTGNILSMTQIATSPSHSREAREIAFEGILMTLVHEWVHSTEKLAWTHNDEFNRMEGLVLSELLVRGVVDKLASSLIRDIAV